MIRVMEKVIKLEPKNLEETICKRYLEIQNVSKLADELNGKGCKIKGRKYIGKDISGIIKETTQGELGELTNILFKYNNRLQNGGTSFRVAMKKFEEVGDTK